METNQNRNWKSPVLLVLTAAIWGFAFVAQSVGMDYVGPFTFNCIRNLCGAIVLLPVIFLLNKKEKKKENLQREKLQQENPEAVQKAERRSLILGGTLCGIFLFVAGSFQQIGIQYTTVGKAGFITALYIIIVPILGIFFKKKCSLLVWISVVLAVIGFYFLTMMGEASFTKGDILVLICALTFSGHILCVDYFAPKVNGVKMAAIQFLVCGILSGIVMLFTETPTMANIMSAWAPILYAGVLSCGAGYTLQIVGQKNFNPTIAALLMSLESVFSVLAGWLILKQALTIWEGLGCALIFAGIVLAQLPVPAKRKS